MSERRITLSGTGEVLALPFKRPRLVLTREFLWVMGLAALFMGLQWIRIVEDDRIVGVSRLAFDGSRFALGLAVFVYAYRLWPTLQLLPAHDESLSRFEQQADILEKSFLKDARTQDIESFQRSSYEQLDAILTRATTLIRNELGANCRLTLKILFHAPVSAADSSPQVVTLLRDQASRAEGNLLGLGKPFSYRENTAFRSILEEGRPYFGASDLQALSLQGKYVNKNRNWPRLYNSTVVVPVKPRSDKLGKSIIGFLCIDSLECNVDHHWIRRRLVSYAGLVYNVFRVLYQFCGAQGTESGDAATPLGWRVTSDAIEPFDKSTQRKIESVLTRLHRLEDELAAGYETATADVGLEPAAQTSPDRWRSGSRLGSSTSKAEGVIESASGEGALVTSSVVETVMDNVSEETRRWLTIAERAPLAELIGVRGDLEFPRPTLEELDVLGTDPAKLPLDRRMVIEAYEARLVHNRSAGERLDAADRELNMRMLASHSV